MVDKFRRIWDEKCKEAGLEGDDAAAVYSWDNPKTHAKANDPGWAKLGINAYSHTGLPTYAPDMHCPIENSHSVVCGRMKRWISRHPLPREEPLQTYLDKLERYFKRSMTKGWAQAAIRRCFSTVLPSVIAYGGDWPPKNLR